MKLSKTARACLASLLITLGLLLQGGLCGHLLGYWGALPAMALGYVEGRWLIGRWLRRAGVLQAFSVQK